MRYLVKNIFLLTYLKGVDFLTTWLPRKNKQMGRVESILLCNIAHLGDVIITTSLISSLKKRYPKAALSFLCSSSAKPILEKHLAIDTLIFFDHWKLNRAPISFAKKLLCHFKTFYSSAKQIRRKRFSLAIDVYPYYPNSLFLLWYARIPIRLGFTSGGFGAFLTHPMHWPESHSHMAEQMAFLINTYFKIPFVKLTPFLPEPKKSLFQGDYMIIHVGDPLTGKSATSQQWKEIILQVAKVYDGQIYFTGQGMREKTFVEEIRTGKGENLVGLLTWEDYCALVKEAQFLIAIDCVAGHVASAFNTPSLTLFNKINASYLWKPLHPNSSLFLFSEEDRDPHFFCSGVTNFLLRRLRYASSSSENPVSRKSKVEKNQ